MCTRQANEKAPLVTVTKRLDRAGAVVPYPPQRMNSVTDGVKNTMQQHNVHGNKNKLTLRRSLSS